jgi:hypothetical protein
MMKLGRFGENRGGGKALRNDANLESICGVEGDHDVGTMSVSEAAARLRSVQLAGLIYSTPSHTPDAPRWRVIVPTSKSLPPAERERLCSRLNGVLGGALAPESFKISQSYYYGRVRGAAAPELEIVDGRAIDTAAELDAMSISKGDAHEMKGCDPDRDERAAITRDPKPLHGFGECEVRRILNTLLEHAAEKYRETRDGWLQVGMALHHNFSGSELAYDLWKDFSQASIKFDEKDQRRNWKSFRDTPNPVTMASLKEAANRLARDGLRNQFDDIAETELDDDIKALIGTPSETAATKPRDPIDEFNEKHAMAVVAGKTVILIHRPDGTVDYSTVTDLNNFYANDRIVTDKGTRPISKFWMEHRRRRSYPNGVVFAPGRSVEGAFNLWAGFSVVPDPRASCDLFTAHLRNIVCGGNDEAYEWLIRWLAHMVQRPWEKPGTAVVLKGVKGSGKDTVGEYFGKLFPRHHTKVGNADHVYGRFNAHLSHTLLLHVEEGFWAGDHKAESQLKHLITSPQILIEPKGVNAFQVTNCLRVFISSNEEWVVPASFEERRFFVLNVSPAVAQDESYFSALYHERDHGGLAALLHHLQNLDLDGFNVRKPPMTEGLRDQKLQSLRNVERWWYEVLSEGELASNEFYDAEQLWSRSTIRVARETLRHGYREWMQRHRYSGDEIDPSAFARRLRKLADLEDVRPTQSGSRVRVYELPPLSQCRASFEAAIGLAIDWADAS